MIELTVKTLDSQNHKFTVEDDTTVKQLKEKIAESINFPIESQRLIYCGRVLQDDKNLSEYNVNGKVIHLVQRPPPQATRSNGNHSVSRNTTTSQPRRFAHFRTPRLDGNAMYLGAMAFPADLMDAQGIQAPPSSHSLSQTRVLLARRMLRRANHVLNRLDNATQEANDSENSPDENENTPPNEEGGDSAVIGQRVITQAVPVGGSIAHVPLTPLSGTIAQAAQAATAAAVAAAMSASQASDHPNITIIRQPTLSVRLQEPLAEGASNEAGVNAITDAQESSEAAASVSADPELNNSTSEAVREESPPRSTSNDPPRPTRTTAMADLMDSLENVNRRLQPFMQRYHQLMRDDPSFEENSTECQEAQRIFSGVSEVMHNLAHAYHAMSDILCDFSQAPPRNLRCRPVLIQHSAVVQAGIPIQAQINVMSQRNNNGSNNSNNNSSSQNSTNSTNPPVTGSVTEAITNTTTSMDTAGSASSEGEQARSLDAVTQDTGNGMPSALSLGPGNVEVYMEVGPGSITIDSLETTVVSNANGNGSGNSEPSVATGSFPWPGPPPPEFLQNLMQAVAGHMIARNGGNQNNTSNSQSPNTPTGAATPTNAGGGQNSQARGNTATHPTTATQTRSTARPHVHLSPATMQSLSYVPGLGTSNFDPYLPCNSHHIHSRRNRQNAFQRVVVGTNTEPSPSTTTAQAVEGSQQSATTNNSQNTQSTAQTDAASTAPLPPQQDRPRSDVPPRQPPTFFSMLSNLGINIGSFLPRPPGPPRPRRNAESESSSNLPRNNTSQTGSGHPPNMSFFMSMLGPEGGDAVPPEMHPMFNQIFQNLADALGGDTPINQGGVLSSNLADLLSPNHSYVEGESIFADLLMVLVRNLNFMDFFGIVWGCGDCLNRIRPALRQFISHRLLNDEPMTDESINRGIDRLLREMRPHLDVMCQVRLRDDIDLVTTTNRYHQLRLPEVIRMIMAEGTNNSFGGELVQWCTRYLREMAAIVLHCCLDGILGLETIVDSYVQQLTHGIPAGLQQLTATNTLLNLRNTIASNNVQFEDIQPYLVYRIAPPTSLQPTAQPTVNGSPEPMDVDGNAAAEPRIEELATGFSMESENLPDVVLGSESWHGVLPSDWVPIIARDTQRQRRQISQPPFSDAYLAGMPSKRRKIVTSAKPQGNLNQIITEQIKSAVDAVGVRRVAALDNAGEDLELQAAYREQVRYAFQDDLVSNPDFTPERFPNATKYFGK